VMPPAPSPGVAAAYAAATAAPPPPYAGFWLRVLAAILDGFVLGIPVGCIIVALAIALGAGATLHNINPDDPPTAIIAALIGFIFLFIIVLAVGEWLYFALLEASSWQATVGKKVLGLYVTDLEGKRISFGRASGRFCAGRLLGLVAGVGGLYFLVSCICVGFTEKKQALHDMIAGCLVMKKV
jgi:uncharacterized RDD family membrane protein YckC